MQVTSFPPPSAIPASGVRKPSAEQAQVARPDVPASGEVTLRSFERALVEAAGLKPSDAAKVRVALSVEEGTNRVIARMYNKETGELIQQMPTDQMLRNAALIREMLGAAVDAIA